MLVGGPLSPLSYPGKYKFVLVLIDDATRAALTYPLKNKSDVPACIESFVKSMRNLVGQDLKFCYLRCDRGTEFTGRSTIEVFNKYGAELQVACPDTPQHNGVAEIFNRTLENKTRVMMLDSGLPATYWDLAVKTAVYIYNRIPHKSLDMTSPLSKIMSKNSLDYTQFKRFGCAAYMKIARNTETKFSAQAVNTGYTVLVPSERKLYDSKHMRFVENHTYKDFRDKFNLGIDSELNFNKDESEHTEQSREVETKEIDKTVKENVTGKDIEKVDQRRRRGRPKKDVQALFFLNENPETEKLNFDRELSDIKYHALLAKIQGDPQTYKEAVSSLDSDK